ncbi:MAG: DUF3991 and TOPRIM domain-containing protein [Kiritimatiellae bacterium]|nr:DUF3991 and TOPRIM domain-containing protein [Kiritimatiellia bacterium]
MSTPAGRERTDRLRALPLTDILRASDATPDPHDPAKWHTERGVISVNGAKFFNWSQATGGGGAIDLAMHLHRMNFKEAVDWLLSACVPARAAGVAAGRPAQAGVRRFPVPQPNTSLEPTQASRRLALPVPAAGALPAIIGYLGGQRRLPLAHLQPLVDSGDLYADRNHNAVFLLRNKHNAPVGAELRGTGQETWRGMAPGSRKDNGYFALGPPCPQAIVLCESAIDAISCRTLYPDRLCISTSGARDNPAWLPAMLARNPPAYCGFDADATGERMAQAMIARYPAVRRLRPPCHDWNDALRAQA